MPQHEFRVTWLHLAGDDPTVLSHMTIQATSVPNALTRFYAAMREQGHGKGRERAGFHVLSMSNMSLERQENGSTL
jgi:hypothetical protein